MLISRIVKLLEIANDPQARKSFLALRKKFSISSFRINSAISNYQPFFHTIIDAGANTGQFALAATQRFPMVEIYCFEPVPDVCKILKSNVKRLSKIHVYNYAIGDINGKIPFYRHDYTPASSAMVMQGDQEDHNRMNCDATHTETIEVEIFRLDDLVSKLEINIEQPALLKLDVQGYEKKVLQGAEKTLESIDYIALEATFVQLYENQPLFEELHEILHTIDFEFVAPLDINEGVNHSIVEMDILYRRVKRKDSANQ
jgi:FkbM family methyltransferase